MRCYSEVGGKRKVLQPPPLFLKPLLRFHFLIAAAARARSPLLLARAWLPNNTREEKGVPVPKLVDHKTVEVTGSGACEHDNMAPAEPVLDV